MRLGVAISLALILAVIIRRTGWDQRCRVREGMFVFVQAHYPQSLPSLRAVLGQLSLPRSMADPLPSDRHAGS